MKMRLTNMKFVLLPLLIGPMLLLTACDTTKTPTNITNQSTSTTQQTIPPQTPATTKSNINEAASVQASRVPKQFYEYLNERNYKSAVSLLGPQLQFEGTPSYIKYIKNIKQVTFIKFQDISSDPGPIDPNYAKYYQIKVYYAEINVEVQNPDLVSGLAGVNYRRFILIKKTKNSPWLIDSDEDTPQR